MALAEPVLAVPETEAAPRPVAVDGIPARSRLGDASPGRVLLAAAIGSVVLAFLASSDLPSWAGQLRDGPVTPLCREAAETWNGGLERLGLTEPHQVLRRAVSWLKDRQWP